MEGHSDVIGNERADRNTEKGSRGERQVQGALQVWRATALLVLSDVGKANTTAMTAEYPLTGGKSLLEWGEGAQAMSQAAEVGRDYSARHVRLMWRL